MRQRRRLGTYQPPKRWGQLLHSKFMERKWTSVRQASEYTEVPHNTIWNHLMGKGVDLATVFRLADKLGIDREDAEQAATEVANVLVEVDSAAMASLGAGAASYGVRMRPGLALVKIRGRCMEPRIRDGEVVLVEKRRDWAPGDVVIVDHEGQMLCKQVVERAGALLLKADDGTTIVPNNDTDVLGIFVGVVDPRRPRV